jgi:hypothetical protein
VWQLASNSPLNWRSPRGKPLVISQTPRTERELAPSPEDGDRFGHCREVRGRFHRT